MPEFSASVLDEPDGGVLLTWFRGQRYAALQCGTDGGLVVLLCDRATDDETVTGEVTPEGLPEALRRARDFLGGAHV